MKKNTQPILALSLFLLFINILLISVFFGSSLHLNNRTIITLPSTSNIHIFEWCKIWGGSSIDDGKGIVVDDSGNVFITGVTSSFGGAHDVLLLKYGTDGNLLWYDTWGGSSTIEEGDGIALDGSGNIFITGHKEGSGEFQYDAFLLKYDSDGNLLWNKNWGGSGHDYGYGIAIDGSGNAFITGYTRSYGENAGDVILLKYDTDGNMLWNNTWGGGPADYGYGIALDGSGNVFITGFTYSYGAGGSDAFVLKYNSDGNQLWNKTWGGSDYERGYGITLDDSGNVFITGYIEGSGAEYSDAFVLKYNSDGNLLWNNTWGGSDYDRGNGIAVDGSGNVFITGYTNSYGAGVSDAFVLKYNSAGIFEWYKTWGGSNTDYGYGIAVDGSGNMFIIGSTRSFGEGFDDIFFLKYEVDSDEDGLSDNKEVNIYFTDPNNSDTDDDGFTDGEEVNSGTDPLNFIDNWLSRGVLISISITALIIVCYIVIRKNKVKKINIIMERGDKLKTQADLEKSIESYQEALLKTSNVIKFVPKSVRSLIKGKLDQTLELQINQLLEKCDKLKKEGEYIGSIESINLASNLTKKIKEKSIKEQFNSKIINILDQIYVEIVNVKIEEALKLREMKNFDESINIFNTALSDVDKIGDKQLKDKFQSILKDYIDTTRMIRIKNLIFDLGQNYTRLDISDIIEKCGEGEGFVLSAIRDMIMNREISAEYFKSNNTVTFKKQVDIEEIDKLMKSFDDWEKESKSKKI